MQKFHLRTFDLFLAMAAIASSCVSKWTSASPVAFPLELYSIVILTGFRGAKNFKERHVGWKSRFNYQNLKTKTEQKQWNYCSIFVTSSNVLKGLSCCPDIISQIACCTKLDLFHNWSLHTLHCHQKANLDMSCWNCFLKSADHAIPKTAFAKVLIQKLFIVWDWC